jgi:alanyl-tRNA synthetase
MGGAYPTLVKDRDLIVEVLEREEAGFARTLRTGLSLLEEAQRDVAQVAPRSSRVTWPSSCTTPTGSPIELTDEIVAESGLRRARGLRRGDAEQRERARSNAKTLNLADDAQYRDLIEPTARPSSWVATSRATASRRRCWRARGQDGTSELFLDTTPFYAESGGQVGDTGTVVTETGRFEVLDTQNVAGGLFAHRGR